MAAQQYSRPSMIISVGKSLERNHALDLVRAVAIYGVIIIHCAPTTPIAGNVAQFFQNFSVPFFLLASLYLFWSEAARTSDPTHALRRRIPRLLIPYAAWTGIYLLARGAKLVLNGQPVRALWSPGNCVDVVFFGGAAVQLYFLPLLAFALGVAWLFFRLLPRRELRSCRLGSVVLFVAGAGASLVLQNSRVEPAGSLWVKAGAHLIDWAMWVIPFVLAAALLAELPSDESRLRRWRGWAAVATAASLDLIILARQLSHAWMLHGLLLAGLALYACRHFVLDPDIARRLKSVLRTSFGVFLIHHLLIEFVELLDHHFGGILTQPYSIASQALVGLTVYAGSVLCTLAMIQSPVLARALLGAEAVHRPTLEPASVVNTDERSAVESS